MKKEVLSLVLLTTLLLAAGIVSATVTWVKPGSTTASPAKGGTQNITATITYADDQPWNVTNATFFYSTDGGSTYTELGNSSGAWSVCAGTPLLANCTQVGRAWNTIGLADITTVVLKVRLWNGSGAGGYVDSPTTLTTYIDNTVPVMTGVGYRIGEDFANGSKTAFTTLTLRALGYNTTNCSIVVINPASTSTETKGTLSGAICTVEAKGFNTGTNTFQFFGNDYINRTGGKLYTVKVEGTAKTQTSVSTPVTQVVSQSEDTLQSIKQSVQKQDKVVLLAAVIVVVIIALIIVMASKKRRR